MPSYARLSPGPVDLPSPTLALDALEMAIWRRQAQLEGLVRYSDTGSQYLAIRYTERLAEAGAVTSLGSRGDSYDNALAETSSGSTRPS